MYYRPRPRTYNHLLSPLFHTSACQSLPQPYAVLYTIHTYSIAIHPYSNEDLYYHIHTTSSRWPHLAYSPFPVDKELPQALGAQHAAAPKADIAAPDPGARVAQRELAELQGRPPV